MQSIKQEIAAYPWYRLCHLFFAMAALLFSILWHGSVPLWRTSVLQSLVLFSFFFYGFGRLQKDKRLIPYTALNRPLLAMGLLVVCSSLFAENKGLACNAMIQFLSWIAGFYAFTGPAKFRKDQVCVAVWIGVITTVLCIYGLMLYFDLFLFPSWRMLASFQHNNLCGTFENHCHMAGWVEMALPFFAGFFFIKPRSVPTKVVMGFVMIILALSLILTQARGGWVAAGAGGLFMAITIFFHQGFEFPKKYVVRSGIGLVVVFFFIIGSKPVTQRGLTVFDHEIDVLSGRHIAWAGTIDMIKSNALTGVGPGNYSTIFTQFQPPGMSARFYRAHSDYLQFTAEMGLGFIPVVIWLVIVFFRAGWKKMDHPGRQVKWMTLGAMGGVVAILVHSAGDFNLQIPSNALLFTVLAAQVAAPAPKIRK